MPAQNNSFLISAARFAEVAHGEHLVSTLDEYFGSVLILER